MRTKHVSVGWNFAGAAAAPHGSFPLEKKRDEPTRRRGVLFSPVVHLVREPLSSIHALAGCLRACTSIGWQSLPVLCWAAMSVRPRGNWPPASRCLGRGRCIDCDAAPSSRIFRPRSDALAIRLPTTGRRTSTRWAASIVCEMASLADDAAASIPQLHPAPQVSYDYAARCVANNTWLHAILHRPFPPSRLTLATAYWMSWNSLAAKHAQVQTRV